ncbi:MAG: MotA/TolQ/ExbB proton channel family protein, partial [Puniceicoccaceae bacterium]
TLPPPAADEIAPDPEPETVPIAGIIDRLRQGGLTMVFLGVLSIAGLSFILERFATLRRKRFLPPDLAAEVANRWKAEDYNGIRQVCASQPSTFARVIDALVRHRTCSTLELSALASDLASREMRLELQRCYPIAIIATLAPLLGLLGTVIGMIDSFEVVAIVGSLGDASLLAGGISKALVTTAVGLGLAIPMLGAYHFFRARASQYAMELETEIERIISLWFLSQAESTQA